MQDIRLNKRSLNLNIMNLSFFKINFVFFSKILQKYANNRYIESIISQKIPLIFLINYNDNESILKSISDTLDLLKLEHPDHYGENKIISSNNIKETKSKNINNVSLNDISINNQNIHPNLTYNSARGNTEIIKSLENIISNIKKNFSINTLNKRTNLTKNRIKISNNSLENSNKIDNISNNTYSKNRIHKKNIKFEFKTKNESQRDQSNNKDYFNKAETKACLEYQRIRKIKSDFERINCKIIRKNIEKLKINKVDYNLIIKNKFLNENINKNINKFISRALDKYKKISKDYKFIKLTNLFNNKTVPYIYVYQCKILSKILKPKNNFSAFFDHFFNNVAKIYYQEKKSKTENLFKSRSTSKIYKSKIAQKTFAKNSNKNIDIFLNHPEIENIKTKYNKVSSNVNYKEISEKYFNPTILNDLLYLPDFKKKYLKIFDIKNYKNKLNTQFYNYKNIKKSINLELNSINKNNIFSTSTYNFREKYAKKYLEFSKYKNTHKYNLNSIYHDIYNNYSYFKYKDFTFDELSKEKIVESSRISDYIPDLKNQNAYSRNIIFKKRDNISETIENLIDKKIKKIFKYQHETEYVKKIQKQSASLPLNKFLPYKKGEQTKETITKNDINQMIKSYIDSMNFKKISDNAISELENKLNLEKYRNGVS